MRIPIHVLSIMGTYELFTKTRQDKTRQDKTRQDKTRQDKTRQDKTRQDGRPRISMKKALLCYIDVCLVELERKLHHRTTSVLYVYDVTTSYKHNT